MHTKPKLTYIVHCPPETVRPSKCVNVNTCCEKLSIRIYISNILVWGCVCVCVWEAGEFRWLGLGVKWKVVRVRSRAQDNKCRERHYVNDLVLVRNKMRPPIQDYKCIAMCVCECALWKHNLSQLRRTQVHQLIKTKIFRFRKSSLSSVWMALFNRRSRASPNAAVTAQCTNMCRRVYTHTAWVIDIFLLSLMQISRNIVHVWESNTKQNDMHDTFS